MAAERVLVADELVGPATVHIDAGLIVDITDGVDACTASVHHLLVPGFIDIQVNGIGDIDVARAEGAQWDALDEALLAQGTTSWCPTLVTAPLSAYSAPLQRVATAMERNARTRPTILGVHLEGPFLGGAPGAHDRRNVVPVDLDWLDDLPPHIAVVTIAPEVPGALAAIPLLVGRGCLVAIGHSTADEEDVLAAISAGAAMATHLFNGMGPFHHRRPGVAGTVLGHPTLAASIIADGVHLHPTVVQLVFRLLGSERCVLVTDSVATYDVPARSSRAAAAVTTARPAFGDPPRLSDGTLAGTRLTMPDALRTCIAAGVPLGDALVAATATPARLLGLLDRGVISVGRRADLVALDDHLDVEQVWIGGVAAGSGSPTLSPAPGSTGRSVPGG